jgi:predicted alpha/beta superfamily hydrolase
MKTIFILTITCLFLFILSQKVWSQPRFHTLEIESKQWNTEKTIWVYLPQNYNENTTEKYPVLYMHDGQNLFDEKLAFAGTWKIAETLDSLKLDLIVIGIAHGNEKRLEELTPFPHEKHGGGKADLYLDFVVSTLKPYVDENFRTKTDVKNTLMMGSSLGGLTSFYAILKYPEVFGAVGVFSPSFWFSEKMYPFAENSTLESKKIYMMCGDSESEKMVEDLEKMVGIIEKNARNTPLKTKIVKGGKHHETLWADEFGEAILWLLK